jgi:DnaJ family protein C protein 3
MIFPLKSLAIGAAILTSHFVFADDIPSDIPISQLLQLATTNLASGKGAEALAYYDAAIARDPTNYLTLFKRGAAYLSLGRSAQASRDFDTVLKLKPGFEGALVQRAKIRTRDGDWALAKEDFLAAGRTADSQDVAELDEAEVAVKLAEEADKAGNWDDCIAQAGIAIQKAPALVKLRDLRSKCRFEKGDVASAVTDLQHVLHLNSGSTEPHLKISALTFYALGETEKGLGQIRKCLQSDPDNKACRLLMRREKAFEKQYKKLNQLLEKKSYASSVRLLVPGSEEPGLIKEAEQDFEELKKDGIIHVKAMNGLHDHLVELACQSYIEVSQFAS